MEVTINDITLIAQFKKPYFFRVKVPFLPLKRETLASVSCLHRAACSDIEMPFSASTNQMQHLATEARPPIPQRRQHALLQLSAFQQ